MFVSNHLVIFTYNIVYKSYSSLLILNKRSHSHVFSGLPKFHHVTCKYLTFSSSMRIDYVTVLNVYPPSSWFWIYATKIRKSCPSFYFKRSCVLLLKFTISALLIPTSNMDAKVKRSVEKTHAFIYFYTYSVSTFSAQKSTSNLRMFLRGNNLFNVLFFSEYNIRFLLYVHWFRFITFYVTVTHYDEYHR